MTIALDLFKEHEYEVTLSHTDHADLGPGTLHFGGNKWARVALQDSAKTRNLAEGTTWSIVKAKTDNGISFTLFDCAIRGHSFYADYVVLGDVQPVDLQKITIRYTDVPEWLANWRRIDGELGDKIMWSNSPRPIAVNLPSEQLKISTQYVAHMDRKGEDHILHEHIEFVVEKTSGAFTLEEAQRATLDISCLLSILLAHPVSPVSVAFVDERRGLQQIYFPGFDKLDKSLSNDGHMTQCFIQARDIEDRWQTIFENYYKSPNRKLIWVRLSGMQRYDSFWEYRALGYVALLDRYVKQATKGKKKSSTLSTAKLSAVKTIVDRVVPSVADEKRKELVSALSVALGEKGLSFAEKFQEALNATDADITKIIGLAGEPFRIIKDLRDAVAHGDDPKLGKDFTQITAIITKIEMLLTYWAFLDFGLAKADFLKCLTTTHSRLRFASQLDEVHLDRTTRSALFLTVSKSKLREISETKGVQIDPCFVVDTNGELHLSEHYRNIYREWMFGRSSSKGSSTSHGALFDVPTDAVRHFGTVYIESGTERLRLYSVYLFDATKLPPDPAQEQVPTGSGAATAGEHVPD